MDFSKLFINLSETSYASFSLAKATGAPTINYGLFLNALIDLIIVAFVVFMLVRGVNRLKPREPSVLPDTKACPYCLSNIP